jgi:small subunit ribosomal protein S18
LARDKRERGGGKEKRGDKKGAWQRKTHAKVCPFCKEKATWVDYKDIQLLRKFVSDRGKIRARRATGACTQHQRDIATAIKNAREMALLPYMSR